KEVVETGECIRCNVGIRDDEYHVAQCRATIPFLEKQDEKIKTALAEYPEVNQKRRAWITAKDTRVCANMLGEIQRERWEEIYGKKWRGSMGCIDKTYTEGIRKALENREGDESRK